MKKNTMILLSSISNFNDFKNSKCLVAVSGGVDSMVLCDLLKKENLNFSIAHCNFQLRGEDSNGDEEFVRNYCEMNQIPFFIKKMDVQNELESANLSIQMAARKLRYTWFEELIKMHSFDFLLTAHHLNDSLETFIINLSRGTGLAGLTGIPNQSSKIIRPLLSYSKAEILQYAVENNILWREDSSNEKSIYVRNKIRHKIVPELMEIQPQFLANFTRTLQILQEENKVLQQHYLETQEKLESHYPNEIRYKISELKELNPPLTYYFHLFSQYGFLYPLEIEKLLKSENGEIQSNNYRLLRNRDELILIKIKEEFDSSEITLCRGEILEKPLYLKVLESDKRDGEATETLDFEHIHFPLRIRKFKIGDHFSPFGMKGSKKMSKFFKDEKYSKVEKENAWILVDAKDTILYLVGKRIDDRFKVTEHTHKFLNIYL